MDKKEIKLLGKSVNSIGYKLYLVKNIENLLDEKISSKEKNNNDAFFFISKNNFEDINPQKIINHKEIPYLQPYLQEITTSTDFADNFFLSMNYYFYKIYWKFFLPEMLKAKKPIFFEYKLPELSELIKEYNFQEIMKIYASAPISTHIYSTASILYEYVVDQADSTLKTVPEDLLAKIFLKTKKAHTSVDAGKASKFEHFFSNPEIIDKIKEHSRFLVENTFSIKDYLVHVDFNFLQINFEPKALLTYLTFNDREIFSTSYTQVFIAIAEFYKYSYSGTTYPSQGVSCISFSSNKDTTPISIQQFWNDVEHVYQTALKNHIKSSEIANAVTSILETDILEKVIPKKAEIAKAKTYKF